MAKDFYFWKLTEKKKNLFLNNYILYDFKPFTTTQTHKNVHTPCWEPTKGRNLPPPPKKAKGGP